MTFYNASNSNNSTPCQTYHNANTCYSTEEKDVGFPIEPETLSRDAVHTHSSFPCTHSNTTGYESIASAMRPYPWGSSSFPEQGNNLMHQQHNVPQTVTSQTNSSTPMYISAPWVDTHDSDDNDGVRDRRARGKTWACPWYKLDPWAHYRCAERYKLRRFSDVKQHILRCHSLQESYYCEHCWGQWKSRGPWETHKQRGNCSRKPEPEQLKQDEVAALRNGPYGYSDEQKWYWIWQTFFGGHQAPPSPYVAHGVSEPIALLQSRADAGLSARLPSLLQSCHIKVDDGIISQLRNGINRIVFNPSPEPRRFRLLPDNDARHFVPGVEDVNSYFLEQEYLSRQSNDAVPTPDLSAEVFFPMESFDDSAMQTLPDLTYSPPNHFGPMDLESETASQSNHPSHFEMSDKNGVY